VSGEQQSLVGPLKMIVRQGPRRDKTGGAASPSQPRAGRDRLFPALGCVEDFGDPRTRPGKGRVLARLGRVGEMIVFSSHHLVRVSSSVGGVA